MESGVCPLCFSRVHSYADKFVAFLEGDRAVDDEEVMGDYGDVLKTTATSTPEPSTFYETVPGTSLAVEDDPLDRETRWQPPRAKRICACGVIDHPELPDPDDEDDDRLLATEDLTNRERYELIENLAERCHEDDRPFALGPAKEVIEAANRKDSLAGKDEDVLINAVMQGLEYGTR